MNALYHGMTALTRAALRPHPSSCLRILLQAGADVNQLDNFGVTALMRAASRVNDNIVALIKAGADVIIISPKLGTALFTAAKSKFVINTRTLLRAGISIGGSRGGREGRTPPPWASKFFRFHAVFGKIWRVHAPPGGFTPPSGKSWIRHWG